MAIHVRLATYNDWEAIVDFNCRLAEESEGKTLDRVHVEPGVQALLADPRKGRYFVAYVEGGEDGGWKMEDGKGATTSPSSILYPPSSPSQNIVGQLMHTYEWSDWRNGDIWWLQSVYVHPDFRRAGVFRAMFDRLLQEAENDPGVVGLRLYVEEQNEKAHATYRNLGLEPGGYFVMERFHRRAVTKASG